MKNFLLLILFIPFLSRGQLSFSEIPVDTSSTILAVNKIVTADFNQDGLEDIATVQQYISALSVYFNNGTAGFGNRQPVAGISGHPVGVTAADINNDGWPDLVTIATQNPNTLCWYPNQNGTFGVPHKIDSAFYFPVNILTADFNNDQIDDLLAIDDTSVIYYENDGTGNFTPHKIAGGTEFYSGNIADINGDSLPDVLLGSTLLYTYTNNGDGTFTRDTRNETLINNFIFEIEMADIDGDHHQDMAVYYANNIPDIDWYKNDGTGKFSFGQNITHNSNDVRCMRLADLDGDGTPELAATYAQTGEFVWMQNNGLGIFGSENILKTYPIFILQIAATDADHDGDMDLFCSHNSEGVFYWENQSPASSLPENRESYSIYPNPISDHLILQNTEPGQLQVYSMDGKEVMEASLDVGKNKLLIALPAGVYLIMWNDGHSYFHKKMLVK